MSIYRLVNNTGADVQLEWANNYTFPNGTPVDLINDVGIDVDDIIGVKAGQFFDDILALLDTSTWKLNNGERNYFYEEAVYLLTNGTLAGYHLGGDAKTIVTHDICNPISWYQNAVKVVDEEIIYVDGKYKAKHGYIICTHSGFIYQEDSLGVSRDHVVKVNGEVVSEDSYELNHNTGDLVFKEGAVSETDTVTMSYWYASSSVFDLQTDNTHLWRILKSEIQLDSNVVFNNPIIMEVIIDHPLAGNDYVASRWVYKNVRDLMNGSNLTFSLPSFGGSSVKSSYIGNIIVLQFNYTKPLELPVGMNCRVRIRMEGDIPPEGNFGTVTFYVDKIKL